MAYYFGKLHANQVTQTVSKGNGDLISNCHLQHKGSVCSFFN